LAIGIITAVSLPDVGPKVEMTNSATRLLGQGSPTRNLPANANVGLLKVCPWSVQNPGQVTRSLFY